VPQLVVFHSNVKQQYQEITAVKTEVCTQQAYSACVKYKSQQTLMIESVNSYYLLPQTVTPAMNYANAPG